MSIPSFSSEIKQKILKEIPTQPYAKFADYANLLGLLVTRFGQCPIEDDALLAAIDLHNLPKLTIDQGDITALDNLKNWRILKPYSAKFLELEIALLIAQDTSSVEDLAMLISGILSENIELAGEAFDSLVKHSKKCFESKKTGMLEEVANAIGDFTHSWDPKLCDWTTGTMKGRQQDSAVRKCIYDKAMTAANEIFLGWIESDKQPDTEDIPSFLTILLQNGASLSYIRKESGFSRYTLLEIIEHKPIAFRVFQTKDSTFEVEFLCNAACMALEKKDTALAKSLIHLMPDSDIPAFNLDSLSENPSPTILLKICVEKLSVMYDPYPPKEIDVCLAKNLLGLLELLLKKGAVPYRLTKSATDARSEDCPLESILDLAARSAPVILAEILMFLEDTQQTSGVACYLNEHDCTLLHHAAREATKEYNNVDTLIRIIRSNNEKNLNAILDREGGNSRKVTALICAINGGSTPAFNSLLNAGANPCTKHNGRASITNAAFYPRTHSNKTNMFLRLAREAEKRKIPHDWLNDSDGMPPIFFALCYYYTESNLHEEIRDVILEFIRIYPVCLNSKIEKNLDFFERETTKEIPLRLAHGCTIRDIVLAIFEKELPADIIKLLEINTAAQETESIKPPAEKEEEQKKNGIDGNAKPALVLFSWTDVKHFDSVKNDPSKTQDSTANNGVLLKDPSKKRKPE